jgi:hypothetical protein
MPTILLSYVWLMQSSALTLQALVEELIGFLDKAAADFLPALTDTICRLVQRLAPNTQWFIDSLMAVLATAGAHVAVRSCSQ